MTTIKSFTSQEQSKKLAEILPIESADMYYNLGESNIPNFIHGSHSDFKCYIMCWSLSALLGALPEIQGGKPIIALDDNYITYPHMSDLYTKAYNLIDACVSMIEKLNELNLL